MSDDERARVEERLRWFFVHFQLMHPLGKDMSDATAAALVRLLCNIIMEERQKAVEHDRGQR